ncbi:cytochrome c [Microvirga massiliensis]|uniref:cytochrome c n=1 Tax=Microvirga massiliensis TaxID=1033741 RepID=UPI00062B6560|nr:cytochrome c [Microvirga massiliensis]
MNSGLGRQLVSVLLCASVWLSVSPAAAAELIVDVGLKRTLTTEELLARPDVATIQVPADVVYQRTMTYRAVPLRALLGVDRIPSDQDLQVIGTDGFVTNLPAGLISDTPGAGAAPWLAIEPPNDPWPLTANGLAIGPFYLVWLDPAASGVRSEQWPFQVASIRTVPARATQWPQLAVADDLPADSPVRTGQVLFATQCMVCHPMSGAGDATMGPDLNMPHNPTEYFQPWALKAFIRNPRSVRVWSEMKMPGFEEASLSDADLDAIIAYLGYMAARRR